MPESAHPEGELGELDSSRRTFIKRLAVGAALAPVVTSFSMSGMSATSAFAQLSHVSVPSNLP